MLASTKSLGVRHFLTENPISLAFVGEISQNISKCGLSSLSNLDNENVVFGCRKLPFVQIDRLSSKQHSIDSKKFQSDIHARYAMNFYEGRGVSSDDISAARYFKLSADAGNVDAQFTLGVFYHCGKNGTNTEDPINAFRYFKAAALNGHSKAQYCYALYLASGTATKRNLAKAVRYFRLAADNGYDEAQYCYGRCLFHGFGAASDYTTAVKYFRMAVDQGNPKAAFYYGYCLRRGFGIKMNKDESIRYVKFAADKDLPEAKLLMEMIEKSRSSCEGCSHHLKMKNQNDSNKEHHYNNNNKYYDTTKINNNKNSTINVNDNSNKLSNDEKLHQVRTADATKFNSSEKRKNSEQQQQQNAAKKEYELEHEISQVEKGPRSVMDSGVFSSC